jgi:alcohol dehydrogenase
MHLPGYFEFGCRVKTLAGYSALEQIPRALTDLGASRPMILTDQGVSAAGLVDTLTQAIRERVSVATVFDGVPTDSDLTVVSETARLYRQHQCDAIIAVGGGSVLDTAKGVNILVSEAADDLRAFSGAGALTRALKPLVAVPTTAGTGSEMTMVAVIADHQRGLKMPFTSNFLQPDVAVLDPRMTLTLPPAITAATAMDALCHAMEAYTCLAKNPLSDACALNAITLIRENLPRVLKQPEDRAGRLALAVAAALAGMAFSNSMVGMVHTLGHAMGGVCHVAHGVCMAILLPYGLEYNLHKNADVTAELLFAIAGEQAYARTPRHLRSIETIRRVRQLNQTLHELTGGGHPRCFKEVVNRDKEPLVPRQRLSDVADAALSDASIYYNPEALDEADFLMVLEAAWEGVPLDRRNIRKG